MLDCQQDSLIPGFAQCIKVADQLYIVATHVCKLQGGQHSIGPPKMVFTAGSKWNDIFFGNFVFSDKVSSLITIKNLHF